MDDATENPKVKSYSDTEGTYTEDDYSGKQELPEMVEPVKPNRHERRKRAKLARMLAIKEKLEAEARKRGK